MAGAAVFAKDAAAAKKAQEDLGKSAEAAAPKQAKLGTEVDKTAAAAKKSATPLDGAAKASKKVGDEAATASTKTKSFAQELGGLSAEGQAAAREVGGAAFGIGAAVGAMVGLTAKAAIDWQTAWTGVTKTVEGTPAQLEAVESGLRGLSKELPSSAEEIAGVAEAAGQLGIQTPNVIAFTRTMIDLGETTNLSANDAATALARFMNVMGTSQDKVSNLGSSIVELGNNYATTEAEILAMATRLSGASRQVGLSEGETLGLAAALSSVGIEAEAGGSAISKVMIDIAASVDKGGDRLDLFAKTAGVSADEFSEKWKTDPGAALALFVTGLANAETQGTSTLGVLEELDITEVRMRDALLRSASASDQFTAAMETGNVAFKDNIALSLEAQKRYETVASKIEITKNNVNDAAITFGEVFLPAINAAADGISAFSGFLGGLNEPTLALIGTTAGLAAVTLLLGGTTLLAVPKIAAYRLALATLSTEMPRLARATSATAGVLTGPWGIAIVAATLGASIITAALDDAKASSEEWANALITAKNAADVFAPASQGVAFDSLAGSMSNFGGSLDKVAARGNDFWTQFATEQRNIPRFKKAMADVGKELGDLASRDLPAAQRAFSLLVEEQDLTVAQQEILLGQMGDYQEALTREATARGIQISGLTEEQKIRELLKLATTESTDGLLTEADAKLAAAKATEEATAASEEWRGMLAGANADFIDFNGGLDSVIRKNQETAQATADATEDTSDSWETYYDGFSFQLADYLTELQTMVDAQNNWESNMVLLSGKVSQGVIDELARMGPEGAPLVAALVTASDEELAQAEILFGERADAATGAFAQHLQDSQLVIAAVAAKYGQTAADEVAAKLASGTVSVEQIMEDYRIAVEGVTPVVDVDTATALTKIQTLMNVLTKLPSATVPVGTGTVLLEKDGGVVDYYANGGFNERHVAQIASAGAMRVWAEPETGGEAYIPLSPMKRARSLQIWEETGRRLGVQGYADGAVVGGGSAPAARAKADRPIYMDGDLFGVLKDMANGEARIVLTETLRRNR